MDRVIQSQGRYGWTQVPKKQRLISEGVLKFRSKIPPSVLRAPKAQDKALVQIQVHILAGTFFNGSGKSTISRPTEPDKGRDLPLVLGLSWGTLSRQTRIPREKQQQQQKEACIWCALSFGLHQIAVDEQPSYFGSNKPDAACGKARLSSVAFVPLSFVKHATTAPHDVVTCSRQVTALAYR